MKPETLLVAALLLAPAISAHELDVPAPEVTAAARELVATLRPALRARCLVSIGDPNRTDWSYLPGPRRGVALEEMNAAERNATLALIRAALSARGAQKAEGVFTVEAILREIEGAYRDPELYYLTVFVVGGAEGGPSAIGGPEHVPWGWRFEGHHLSLNFSSLDGRIVASTPAFLGAHPARVESGPRAGWRLLPAEEDLARRLLASLDPAQRSRAIIATRAPSDIILGAGRKPVPVPAGLAFAEMTSAQRETLRALIDEYVGNTRDDVARAQRRRIEEAGLDRVRFAWAGGEKPGEGHYYRVQGPTFLIEYDNTQDDANHVHSVFRDLENDFGGDVLRRHYDESHK